MENPLGRGGCTGRQGSSAGPRHAAAGRVLLALVLLSSPLFLGCDQPCEGPGCQATYGAALVTLYPADTLPPAGVVDPLDAWVTREGLVEQGAERSLAIRPGQLLVGIPAVGAVATFPVDPATTAPGTALALEDTVGGLFAEGGDDHFGAALAVVGDQDGDGAADLLVGAPRRPRDAQGFDEGAVYLFSGAPAAAGQRQDAGDALLRVSGEDAGGGLGEHLAACGDVDGDGIADWVAGASRAAAPDGTALAGRVVLVRAADAAGLDARVEADVFATTWFGGDLGERAGASLACGDDLDRDGLADLVVGAPFADGDGEARGRVYVLSGGAGLDEGGVDRRLPERADRTLEGTRDQAWLGWSVATGDLDGDGQPEVAAGAPGLDEQTGRVELWRGSGRGSAFWTVTHRVRGARTGDAFGRTVAMADLDGDGLDDLLVGAPRVNPDPDRSLTSYEAGTLYLFAGSPDLSDWDSLLYVSDARLTWVRAQPYLRTGQALATGDLDGDDADDLALLHRIAPD